METVRPNLAPLLNAFASLAVRPPSGTGGARPDALEHGLIGLGVAPLPDEAEAVARRAAEWNSSLRPHNPFEFWLAEQIALESLRVERCQEWERNLSALAAERAALGWEEDRSFAAEVLGTRLKSKPALVSGQLRRTKQGCDWLLSRWVGLGAVLLEGRDWDEAQRALALDLLGTPLELRTGTTAVDAPKGVDDARAFRLELVREEIAGLERLRATVLEVLDAREQAAAARGLPSEPDRATAQARRYEAACMRRLQWAVQQLKAGRRASGLAAPLPEREGAPASAPVPAPVGPDRAWFEARSGAVPSGNTDRAEAEVLAETRKAFRVGSEVEVETRDGAPIEVEDEADRRDATPVEGAAEDVGAALPEGTDDTSRFGPTPTGPALLGSPRAPGLISAGASSGMPRNRRARRAAEARRRRARR